MKKNTPIDREFHALSVSKNNSVPKVGLHLQNLILVRIAKKYGKTEISSFKFHRIAMYYTPLERAFKTEQNGVFQVRISSIFHAYFSKTLFWKTRLIFFKIILEVKIDFGNGIFF